MGTPFLAGQASLWLQPDGPNTAPIYLGCHEAEGPSQDKGELNAIYCPDERVSGKFKLAGTYVGEPGLPEATVRTTIDAVLDALEEADCRGTLFIHKVRCGRRDLFTNFSRSMVLHRYHVTSEAYADLAARTPGDEAESTYEAPMQADALFKFVGVQAFRQTHGGAGDLLAIATCSTPHCADDCGPAVSEGEKLVAVGKELTGSALAKAAVWISEDHGATWSAASAYPFAAGEDISAVLCFPIDASTSRIIVARGSTDAGSPAEIAYSDNDGANWTAVNVGALNGQYVVESEGLCMTDPYHIWLAATDGYVYFSGDMGLTWTLQTSGLTAADLRCVEFEEDGRYGYAAGDSNAVIRTADGGATWALLTGPTGKGALNITALDVLDANHAWVGFSDADLFYTDDGGVNWFERNWSALAGAGSIPDIVFGNPLEGYLLHNTAGPVGSIWRTIDGGYNWQRLPSTPTNAGLNAMIYLGANHAHAVGNLSGGTPVVFAIDKAA